MRWCYTLLDHATVRGRTAHYVLTADCTADFQHLSSTYMLRREVAYVGVSAVV